MNMIRIALIFRVAGLEIGAAISAAFLAVWGGSCYFDYLASDLAKAPFTPGIYVFGLWPYLISGIAAACLSVIAIYKIRNA